MDEYVARQAVFDRNHKVIGYELLFRSGPENFFSNPDGDAASQKVIETSLNTFGLGRLSAGARAFINVTPKLIAEGLPSLLPATRTALELVGPSQNGPSLPALQALSAEGCWIVIDDYTAARAKEPAAALADVVKVDFAALGPADRQAVVRTPPNPRAQFLAKKVESRDQLLEAIELGYSLFQGYFFCKPELLSNRKLPAFKANYLRLIGELNKESAGLDSIEAIIRQDLSLSLKILRYINSALFSLAKKVDSIRQAVALVGLAQIKRWATLLAVTEMAEDRPQELVVTSLLRARFCEELVKSAPGMDPGCDPFMTGLLSLLDAVLGLPMEEALAPLPLSDSLKGALLRRSGDAGRVLQLAIAYERAEWDQIPLCADRIPITALPAAYREAVRWADEIHGREKGSSRRRPT